MFDRSGDILVLTGPPGAGKSTTARSLMAASEGPAVHLHADDFWHFIKKGAIPPFLPEAHKQNEIIMAILSQAAEGYAKGGYFVIVDGIVGPWFLHLFRTLGRRLHYIILRPALDSAIERCRLRGGETLTETEIIGGLHKQFVNLKKLERHVIETLGHSPEETVAAVQEALLSGRFRMGSTSWAPKDEERFASAGQMKTALMRVERSNEE